MEVVACKSSDEEALKPGGGKAAAARPRETGRLVESTQAEDRRMISQVAARPLLYARSTLPVASYYSQVKQLWQEVADIMGWTVAEVRRKWSHIRNSYSRHLRNEMHGMRTGRGRAVSRWYLADELEFLRDHMATDTRPPAASFPLSASYSPSLLELAEGGVGGGVGGSAGAPPQDAAPGAWYVAPEPPPHSHDDSCSSFDESTAYFDFFRAIHKDYLELAPSNQRMFRRQCLILLHELVDGGAGAGDGGALNLSRGGGGGGGAGGSGADSDSEREHKFLVHITPDIITPASPDTS